MMRTVILTMVVLVCFLSCRKQEAVLPATDQGDLSQKMTENNDFLSLKQMTWEIFELEGVKVLQSSEDLPLPWILFSEQESRANGSDGCNNFMASYTQQGKNLQITDGASTLRFCHFVDNLDVRFMEMIHTVDSFDIQDDILSFFDANDVLLAKFLKKGE